MGGANNTPLLFPCSLRHVNWDSCFTKGSGNVHVARSCPCPDTAALKGESSTSALPRSFREKKVSELCKGDAEVPRCWEAAGQALAGGAVLPGRDSRGGPDLFIQPPFT